MGASKVWLEHGAFMAATVLKFYGVDVRELGVDDLDRPDLTETTKEALLLDLVDRRGLQDERIKKHWKPMAIGVSSATRQGKAVEPDR